MTNIVDTPIESLAIGLRVEAVFEPAGKDIAIPLFRASARASKGGE
jgi:hypothetical protein